MQSECWYQYVTGVIRTVNCILQSLFQTIWRQVVYRLGVNINVYSTKYTWEADWLSERIIVSPSVNSWQYSNTLHNYSYFRIIKHWNFLVKNFIFFCTAKFSLENSLISTAQQSRLNIKQKLYYKQCWINLSASCCDLSCTIATGYNRMGNHVDCPFWYYLRRRDCLKFKAISTYCFKLHSIVYLVRWNSVKVIVKLK